LGFEAWTAGGPALGDFEERGADVDSGNQAGGAGELREGEGRSTDSAAKIENLVSGSKIHLGGDAGAHLSDVGLAIEVGQEVNEV
jgi:hypothetical protein